MQGEQPVNLHGGGRREDEKMIIIDITGLVYFPNNSTFSFIGEWPSIKGSTHPPSPGTEGWSRPDQP